MRYGKRASTESTDMGNEDERKDGTEGGVRQGTGEVLRALYSRTQTLNKQREG
jgi:hypothetical protein